MSQPSAAQHLLARTQKKLVIAGSVFVVGTAIMIGFASVAVQETMKTKTEVQEKTSLALSSEGVKATQTFMKEHPDVVDALLTIFPNYTTFPDVIAQLETLVSLYDVNGVVQTSSDKPTKVSSELSIPFSITLSNTAAKLSEFLIQLEHLPYIVEVTHVQVLSPAGTAGLQTLKLGVRLYVQDPFTKTHAR